MKKKISAWARAVMTIVAVALTTSTAVAEDYVPVPDKDPMTIAANPFVAGAYGFIWLAVLLYVVHVARGLGRARSELDELRRKLGSGA
jgi:CcmD family protein